MAYVVVNTWSNGDVVLAGEVMENLDDLKTYAQRVAAADLDTSASWADSKHIVNGRFEPVSGLGQFVSGQFGGVQHSNHDRTYTYVTAYNTDEGNDASILNSPMTKPRMVPLTGVTLRVMQPMSLLVQWWASQVVNSDANGLVGLTEFTFHVNGVHRLGLESRGWEETGTTIDTYKMRRHPVGGFYMLDVSSAHQEYSIGVSASSTAAKTRLYSWGVTVEAFYK